MKSQSTEITININHDLFQHIESEKLSMQVINNQILASSRIVAGQYSKVVFSDCTFYACNFNDVEFKDCIFDNCRFEFSHLRDCYFENCNFHNCTWKCASLIQCTLAATELDQELSRICKNGTNFISALERELRTDIFIELVLAA